ncbi:beta family protein [Sinorhizobium fredii]|uniref:beta family protein n=1 Tax=Rhizobium fredii TaxID=380 RepID=UPI001E46E23C|nr:beta family protein [Sinorhizobium fredii]
MDLCTEQDLMNDETLELFDETGGYSNWLSFLQKNFSKPVIPCALYIELGREIEFKRQVSAIVAQFGKVCIRTSVLDEFASTLYGWALDATFPENIVLCPVLYYIDENQYDKVRNACEFYIIDVVGNSYPDVLIFAGSSFPRYVTELPGCGDEKGSFPLIEVRLENELRQKYPLLLKNKADFASVHPHRYPTKGGNWVPRIDYVDGGNFRYSRVRRDKGGYAAAAMRIDTPSIAKLPKCWGADQIMSAKNGKVLGGSPSFWISVRINCWITQRSA